MEKYAGPGTYDCKADPNCIAANIPLLKNVRTGPIDPDTPKSAMTRKSADGVTQKLVVSRTVVTARIPLNFESFPMNSILQAGHSMTATIRTSRLWICGTE